MDVRQSWCELPKTYDLTWRKETSIYPFLLIPHCGKINKFLFLYSLFISVSSTCFVLSAKEENWPVLSPQRVERIRFSSYRISVSELHQCFSRLSVPCLGKETSFWDYAVHIPGYWIKKNIGVWHEHCFDDLLLPALVSRFRSLPWASPDGRGHAISISSSKQFDDYLI